MFTWSCGVEIHSENGEKKTYIVQSEILTISLQERKVIKNDLCPPLFRIHVGKSINIPVLLLCFLVNFHICVDLPHKGTCSHVSNGTWKTNVFCQFLSGGLATASITLSSHSAGKSITGQNVFWRRYPINVRARKCTSYIYKITSQTSNKPRRHRVVARAD